MEGPGRLLVVMRHAKAEPFGDEDYGRRLTDRGRRDATDAGRWLTDRGYVPDHAFVSPATRTVQTWTALARGCGASLEPDLDDALYNASPETMLEVVRTAPEDSTVVAVVGHSPTVAYVVHLLDDGNPDPAAFREISEGYPTSAATVLSVPVSWADLDEQTAHIVDFHVGHG
ncbi:MAG: histidine phosphatase family protein [Actinomycetota bacterium]|nr:histidine phosphatase family protein [Actinomycetota bacterium]